MIATSSAVGSVRATALIVFFFFSAYFNLKHLYPFDLQSAAKPLIPRHIWQTWRTKELDRYALTWPARNPGYEYTLLDDQAALEFVQDYYKDCKEIRLVFESATEPVIRADLIRYLVLYACGGVYSDYDTENFKSIDLWTGDVDKREVGLIVGLEYDQREDEIRFADITHPVQFSQWTLASRPGHPVLRHVLDRVISKVSQAQNASSGLQIRSTQDVLTMTGPAMFTEAMIEGISMLHGSQLDYKDFSMLQGPVLYGDVLILPINAFGSGQPHSGSAEHGNPEQLVAHHFLGSWRAGLSKGHAF